MSLSSNTQLVKLVRESEVARRLYRVEQTLILRMKQSRAFAKYGRQTTFGILGVNLVFDLTDLSDFIMFSSLEEGKGYEPGTLSLIVKSLHPGDVFVDVGASNGFFSLIASRLVGPSGRVYSFEPNPRALARLRRNITANGDPENIEIIEAAVSDSCRRVKLYTDSSEDRLSSLTPISRQAIVVDSVTLDSAIREKRVSLVKIDAEGEEVRVIKGMHSLIRANPEIKVVVEWNPLFETQSLWDQLWDQFELTRIDETSDAAHTVAVNGIDDLPRWCNLYCVRRNSVSA
jgi:FkbM family methyltransferase